MTKTIFEKHVAGRKGFTLPQLDVPLDTGIPEKFQRANPARLPELSELDVMRHFTELASKNHCIEKGFYPLGSCTMKYNPKINETLVRNPAFNNLHPMQGCATTQGSLQLLFELQKDLAKISGFATSTLQPVAGAQGEFAGLKVIRAYHQDKGNDKNEIILPDSAHGTNPASVVLAGYKVVEIKSNSKGMIDLDELRAATNEKTAGFMLTNPNTLGIFESSFEEIARIIHEVDGLMYMDGANFNALLGRVKPGEIGFDIMHYNIHKTFATPHGGGGPGSGPIGVREDLAKYLPVPMVNFAEGKYWLDYSHEATSIGKLHSFYGNFAVNFRAYVYLKMLGARGLERVSENAIINANYIMRKLEKYYQVPFDEGCMHEFVASGKWQKDKHGVSTLDIAKRILDKGMHAPTIYFPLIVKEALMIEPTETESKETLDKFIAAMIEIAAEAEKDPELLHHAPLNTPVQRVDDTKAVRELDVKFPINN
jgi:glycine dehydrogenase subunit 2